MKAHDCVCRTAALRLFVKSFLGPSAQLGTPRLTSRLGQATLLAPRHRPWTFTSLSLDQSRAFHNSSFRYHDASVSAATEVSAADFGATVTSQIRAPSISLENLHHTDQTTDNVHENTNVTTSDVAAEKSETPLPTPGKNRRKKLRKQREKEEAEAAARAAAEAAGEQIGEGGGSEVVVSLEEVLVQADAQSASTEAEGTPEKTTTEKKRRQKGDRKQKQGPREPREPREPRKTKELQAEEIKKDRGPRLPKNPEHWQSQKVALKTKFPEGWNPMRKLSPDAIEGIRALNKQYPDVYTTPALARQFMVSPEAIRRILRRKWDPTATEEEDRQNRWFKRGKKVWSRWAELGRKPPKKWQAEGIKRDHSWVGRRKRMMEARLREEAGEEGFQPAPTYSQGKRDRVQQESPYREEQHQDREEHSRHRQPDVVETSSA